MPATRKVIGALPMKVPLPSVDASAWIYSQRALSAYHRNKHLSGKIVDKEKSFQLFAEAGLGSGPSNDPVQRASEHEKNGLITRCPTLFPQFSEKMADVDKARRLFEEIGPPPGLSSDPVQRTMENEVNGLETERQLGNTRTTLKLQNMPTTHSNDDLLDFLDRQGFNGKYDLVYLPIMLSKNAPRFNKRYAFVNCTSNNAAVEMMEKLAGILWTSTDSCEDTVKIEWAGEQGYSYMVELYRNSSIMHKSYPADCRPRVFADGRQVDFPPPTQVIKPFKFRNKKVAE